MSTKRFFLAVLVTAVVTAPADALVFCKGRGAAVLVREKCRRREQQIDATTIGDLMGAPGTPGPGLHVVDKNGNEVGLVTADDGSYMRIVRQVNGEFFNLEVSGSGFGFQYGNDGLPETGYLYYTDAACTSAPFVPTDQGQFLPLEHPVTISADGRTGYYGLVSEQQMLAHPYMIEVEAGMDDPSARANCTGSGGQIVKDSHDCVYRGVTEKCVWCCRVNGTDTASPAHTLDLTSFGLTPPFTLKRQ